MSQPNPFPDSPEEDRSDPTGLPLFAADEGQGPVPRRPGRVRSAFSLGEDIHHRPGYLHAVGRTGGDDETDEGSGAGEGRGGRTTGGNSRDGIDWALVAVFRSQASEQLSAAVGQDRLIDHAAQEQLGRSIINELLESEAAEAVSAGRPSWSVGQQERMADAIFDALFGLGRFQPLVDEEAVENIEVYGHDNVLLEYGDGTIQVGPAVAENDEELIEFLGFLGSRAGSGRPFSEAQPRLHMRLEGGARLAAMAWNTPWPVVVIRRHRMRDTNLAQLSATGMFSRLTGDFMEAAVKARLNIVVAGPMGGGKTTLVRGLCAAIDPWEKIGTFETEYELFLDELPHKHRRVIPFEARPGSGEVGMNGRQAGEVTLNDLLYDSFRLNLGRVIVGEVRGPEILAMIRAMQSTSGSISTTHGANARATIRKLIGCAMEAGTHISEGYATSAVTGHIDLIIQVSMEETPSTQAGAGRRKRWISEIISVEPGEQAIGYATQQVFRPVPGGPAMAAVMPDHLRATLEAHGFDYRAFEAEASLHEGPAS